jgi:hypothetical protein
VSFAKDFKISISNVSLESLDVIQKVFTLRSSDNPNIVMMVVNHPVVDSILDVLNAPEIIELILIRSNLNINYQNQMKYYNCSDCRSG